MIGFRRKARAVKPGLAFSLRTQFSKLGPFSTDAFGCYMFFTSRRAALLAVMLAFASTASPVMARCLAFSALSAPRSMKARRQLACSSDESGHDLREGLPTEPAVPPNAVNWLGWLRGLAYGIFAQAESVLDVDRREAALSCFEIYACHDSPAALRLRC